jgi:hypothetical protein
VWGTIHKQTWVQNIPAITKGDYAANAGDSLTHAGNGFSSDQFWPSPNEIPRYPDLSGAAWQDTSCKVTQSRSGPQVSRFCQSGVIHYHSDITIAQITDGTTNTYMLGEKFLSPDMYEVAEASTRGYGDNQGAWAGFEWDNHRVAWHNSSTFGPEDYQPRQDRSGVDNPNIYAFGSAHAASMHMAMCDGSLQSISYDIDRDVHRYLASRLDGQVVVRPD